MKKITLAKIILGWGILGFFAYGILNIGSNIFPIGCAMKVAEEPIEEEIAYAYAPEEEYITPEEYIDTKPLPLMELPSARKNTIYPSGKGEIVSQSSKPMIIVNPSDPTPTITPHPPRSSIFSEGVLISLITTFGAILNTLLLRKKQN